VVPNCHSFRIVRTILKKIENFKKQQKKQNENDRNKTIRKINSAKENHYNFILGSNACQMHENMHENMKIKIGDIEVVL
jgi:predicted Fe-Mo cluster-binding NifX family protein